MPARVLRVVLGALLVVLLGAGSAAGAAAPEENPRAVKVTMARADMVATNPNVVSVLTPGRSVSRTCPSPWAASVVLASGRRREAARQSQAAQDALLDDSEEIDMWSRGVHFDELGHVLRDETAATEAATAAVRTPVASAGVSQRTLWTCVAVMAGGTGLIGLCVTILKYTHELIETANAARILGG